MDLNKIFWQSEYPIYLLADLIGYNQRTVINIANKLGVESYKKHGTRFISRDGALKLAESSDGIISKIEKRYYQNNLTR